MPNKHENYLSMLIFKKILFIHDRHREREAETQAEGEAGSMQGAQRRRTQSWVSRITPWTEGSAKLLSHPGIPRSLIFKRMNKGL